MTGLVEAFALISAGLNGVAAALGAWASYRFSPSRAFWFAARAGQLGAIALALVAGVAAVAGEQPDDGLFWVYGLTPVAVSFFAEQLRALSAVTVLEARGLPDAQAVGALPAREQRVIALLILRREIVVMTVAAAVIAFLSLRAFGTAAGL